MSGVAHEYNNYEKKTNAKAIIQTLFSMKIFVMLKMLIPSQLVHKDYM